MLVLSPKRVKYEYLILKQKSRGNKYKKLVAMFTPTSGPYSLTSQ